MTTVPTPAQGIIPLRKEGDLHVLMVALVVGAALPEHSVQAPTLVQAIRGELTLHAGDESWTLGPEGLLTIAPGLDHSVETIRGCVMLVVVQNAGELHLFGSDAPIRCGGAS